MGLPVYSVGTANVANGNQNVSFAGGAALQSVDPTTGATLYVCGAGDLLVVPGDAKAVGVIQSITDATHLVLETPWQGTTNAAAAFKIYRQSVPFTGSAAKLAQDVLNQGSDTTPDVSRTIDNGVARVKLRVGSDGKAKVAVGPTLTADAGLLNALSVDPATGAVSFPSGVQEYVLGFRNRWANGAFDIWQRGTSFSVANGAAAYTADRVLFVNSLGVTATVAKVASPANFRTPSALNFTATGVGATSSASVAQRFESFSVRDIAGSAATLSFDLNATTSAGLLGGSIAIVANSAPDNGTYSSSIFSTTFAVPVGTGKVVVPIPSGNTAGFANGIGILIMLAQFTSAGNVIVSIGSIQLEKGAVANDFEYRPVALEITLCQRFFQVGNTQWFGYTQSGSFYTAQQFFKVTMRAAPTVAQTNAAAIGFSATPGQTTISVNGFTSYRSATATGASQEFDETWTASAEL